MIRRAVASGISSANMMVLLLWFHFCIVYEKIDPPQGGYLRRKHRRDRRPTLPRESVVAFYSHYLGDMLYKHYKMAQLAWRFHWFPKLLKADPVAKNYSDVALTPDEDTDVAELEMMLTQITVAR